MSHTTQVQIMALPLQINITFLRERVDTPQKAALYTMPDTRLHNTESLSSRTGVDACGSARHNDWTTAQSLHGSAPLMGCRNATILFLEPQRTCAESARIRVTQLLGYITFRSRSVRHEATQCARCLLSWLVLEKTYSAVDCNEHSWTCASVSQPRK